MRKPLFLGNCRSSQLPLIQPRKAIKTKNKRKKNLCKDSPSPGTFLNKSTNQEGCSAHKSTVGMSWGCWQLARSLLQCHQGHGGTLHTRRICPLQQARRKTSVPETPHPTVPSQRSPVGPRRRKRRSREAGSAPHTGHRPGLISARGSSCCPWNTQTPGLVMVGVAGAAIVSKKNTGRGGNRLPIRMGNS